MTDDLLSRAAPFLNQCGPCDYSQPISCTCPSPDYRPVMLDLVREVERLRAEAAEQEATIQAIAARLPYWADRIEEDTDWSKGDIFTALREMRQTASEL